ncbi:unnamed protein product [Chrysoparadoxa australica]
MANNGNNARDRVNEHVEFVVKAQEDLILEGKERSLVRVRAGTPYSCLMLKNQRFSSLFRHYAKHHGLKKDDLTYYFTEELQNEDTPESVFLQTRDEIVVKKKRPASHDEDKEMSPDEICPNSDYISQISSLLLDDEHCDVTFHVGTDMAPVRAHKSILVARSEYFKSMFRKGAMKEGQTCEINIKFHEEQTMRWLLEFIYTNRVAGLQRCSAEQLCALLSIAEEYMLEPLKLLCEHTARQVITPTNIAKLLSAAEQFRAIVLRDACMTYFRDHMPECTSNSTFSDDIIGSPRLSISILQHMSEKQSPARTSGSSSSRSNKRRRVDNIEVYDQAS